jgi:hypothetical protein
MVPKSGTRSPDSAWYRFFTVANRVAVAGGTSAATIVTTFDPAQVANTLRDVLAGIRDVYLSCKVPIPAPPVGTMPGYAFVNVSVTGWHTPRHMRPGFARGCWQGQAANRQARTIW